LPKEERDPLTTLSAKSKRKKRKRESDLHAVRGSLSKARGEIASAERGIATQRRQKKREGTERGKKKNGSLLLVEKKKVYFLPFKKDPLLPEGPLLSLSLSGPQGEKETLFFYPGGESHSFFPKEDAAK